MALFLVHLRKKIMANKTPVTDLPDSEKDKKKLQPDEAILDLPDVKDIPGQENIHVPDLREMADTTISSDDEEGIGLFNDVADKDLTSERLGPAREIDENDLIIDDNKDPETQLDKEDDTEDEDEIDIVDDSVSEDSDVRPDEIEALERSAENMDTTDNENLYRAELDDKDFDGEKLNEEMDISGKDLDVPGEEDDDANEEIGEEDEENNAYSLGDNE